MHKVSVIVPVYNVEPYLEECLDSIVNQTYRNLEIILVDDGSTDRCPQICDQYASRDDRITVIHKENGGPGAGDARNAGLACATGKYFISVDSDDILSDKLIKTLVSEAEEKDADIVACEFLEFNDSREIPSPNRSVVELSSQDFDGEEALESLMRNNLKQVVWNKLCRQEAIAGIRFVKGVDNEDEFWAYEVMGNAKLFVQLSTPLIYYRRHPKSIMGKEYNVNRIKALDGLQERVAFVQRRFPKLLPLAIKTFCFASMYHYQLLVSHREVDPKRIHRKRVHENIRSLLRQEFPNGLRCKEVIWFKLFATMPELTCRIRNQFKIGL